MKKLLISLVLIFSFILVSTPALAEVGMSIRKNDALADKHNL